MSKNKKDDEEKITVKQLLRNLVYILKYAFSIDKWTVILVFSSFIIGALLFSIYDTLFLKMFIDMLQNKDVDLAKIVGWTIVFTIAVSIGELMEAVAAHIGEARFVRITGRIQKDFIKKASGIDLMCYDNKKYFDDFVIAASQAEEMVVDGIMTIAYMFGSVTSIFTLGVLIMTINPIVAIFPILGFLINMVTRFRITTLEYNYEMYQKKTMRKADYSKRVFYQPEYAKEIKLSNIDVPLRRQFNSAIDDITDEAKSVGVKIAILSLINWIGTFTFLSYFCIPLYLGYLALVKMSIGLGDLAAMNNAQGSVRNALDAINYELVEFQRVGQFSQRFRRFLDYQVKIEDSVGKVSVPENKQELELKNVCFRYDGAEQDTLKNINIKIKPGEKIAIVGENGAGKTTFVKLLMRLYDVTDGSIMYGGHDIRDYSTKDYRDIFGAVFQDFQLYGLSLAENVVMDEFNEEDRERVETALKLADFGKKLGKLKNGIDTQMLREFDDDGTMLSGGESQKVAISRMFAKRNKLSIAILDEPSSALDPLAEYKLNKNMMESVGDASVIFISHRLSTTRDADKIYMFEQGEIIEQGTHDELMALHGQYAEMFEKQAHYYILSGSDEE